MGARRKQCKTNFPAEVLVTDLAGRQSTLAPGTELVIGKSPLLIARLPAHMVAQAQGNRDKRHRRVRTSPASQPSTRPTSQRSCGRRASATRPSSGGGFRGTYSGNANLDGTVDGDDYTYWLNGFLNTTDPAIQGWLRGDFDYNGVIDGDDYTQWLNSFLSAGPPLTGSGPSPVPEPATLTLLGMAAISLVVRAWRRTDQKA